MGYDIDYGYIFDDEIIEQSVRSDCLDHVFSNGVVSIG